MVNPVKGLLVLSQDISMDANVRNAPSQISRIARSLTWDGAVMKEQ